MFRDSSKMILKLWLILFLSVASSISGLLFGLGSRNQYDDYQPAIRLLQETRRQEYHRINDQRRQHRYGHTNRYDPQASRDLLLNNNGLTVGTKETRIRDDYVDRQNIQSVRIRDSGTRNIHTPILTPGSGFGSGSGNIYNPSAGGISSNYSPFLPNFSSGSQIGGQFGVNNRQPYPIERVNTGVSTILDGVRSLDLGQILRGAFTFPRNDNVRGVANTVLDSIFGIPKEPLRFG